MLILTLQVQNNWNTMKIMWRRCGRTGDHFDGHYLHFSSLVWMRVMLSPFNMIRPSCFLVPLFMWHSVALSKTRFMYSSNPESENIVKIQRVGLYFEPTNDLPLNSGVDVLIEPDHNCSSVLEVSITSNLVLNCTMCALLSLCLTHLSNTTLATSTTECQR